MYVSFIGHLSGMRSAGLPSLDCNLEIVKELWLGANIKVQLGCLVGSEGPMGHLWLCYEHA